jgi:rhodanese-related sulfurtransferase
MQKITVDEVKPRLDSGEPLFFIDARSDESWGKSDLQIPDSIRVPPNRADEFAAALPPDATIITYCT